MPPHWCRSSGLCMGLQEERRARFEAAKRRKRAALIPKDDPILQRDGAGRSWRGKGGRLEREVWVCACVRACMCVFVCVCVCV